MNFKLITRNFNIAPFSAIGENVLQNFKGYFNSDIDVTGTFYKPIFEGYINAVDSGFDVPYPGLRYGFVDDPTFTLNNQTINIKDFTLNEKIKYEWSNEWKNIPQQIKRLVFRFKIESKNLIALNTQSSENEYYYGTGFLNGSAYFIGPERFRYRN